MKKSLLFIVSFCLALGITNSLNAQRYNSEIFSSVTKIPNITYGKNIQVLTGSPVLIDLQMDVYTPDGDANTNRPLVIIIHTGSWLPILFNGQTTGDKSDSAVVVMCRQFAKRGYVAAAINYRIGWNPSATGTTTGQDIRTGTLLQAVYRTIQDVKACVRYFRNDVAVNSNQYGIDSSKIILGGLGSGGYVSLAYATLDKTSEIELPKFLANNTVPAPYNFVPGFSYVNQGLLGGFEGENGNPALNDTASNHLGVNSKVQFIFNMGGAMGDSSWLEAGDAPMVNFHVIGDPFAPYGNGTVVVPTTGDLVVDVSGSQVVSQKADLLGNNACFANAGFTDAYTLRANAINGGIDGLFPFEMIPAQQAGPWDWWDSTAVRNLSIAYTGSTGKGDTALVNSSYTNPDMDSAKSASYIDTVMNYLNPRIVYCLGLATGINENNVDAKNITIQPNPANQFAEISSLNPGNLIQSYRIFDILGNEISSVQGLKTNKVIINRNNLKAGVYLIKLSFDKREITKKLIFR